MARLTKAQLKVLDEIKRQYEILLERGLTYHREKLAAASEAWEVDYHKECLAMYEDGYITWDYKNSSILELMKQRGDIDFIKDNHVNPPGLNIGWVKLL